MPTIKPSQLTLTASLLLLAACQQAPSKGPASRPMPPDVLATVNGAPLTATDVKLRIKASTHQGLTQPAETPEVTKNVLDQLVKQELAAQRAVELGYENDPAYLERVREKEAEWQAIRRKELADLFYRKQLGAKAEPTEEELKKYFDENAARIRTELHVYQIFRRDEATIRDVEQKLAAGQSFEDVAAAMFPPMPEGERKPWDLGFLTWKQIPEAWTSVIYDLQPGETSKRITSGKDRFWILKLVEKRENPTLTLEQVRPALVKDLEQQKLEAKRAELESQLEGKAKVSYTTPAAK